MTPEGERLHGFLNAAISELSGSEKSEINMRGMQRLANLTSNLTKEIDAKADAVADRIEKAHARGVAAIGQFETYAANIEQTADEIESQLGQISNVPPTPA